MAKTRANWASAHVLWAETECHSTPPAVYPIDWRLTRLPKALASFEAVRAIHGTPLQITSFYRTPAYNAAIGGAVNSQHCQGTAWDAEPPDGVRPTQFYEEVVALAQARPDLQIGFVAGYPVSKSKPRGQIHVDNGPAREHKWIST